MKMDELRHVESQILIDELQRRCTEFLIIGRFVCTDRYLVQGHGINPHRMIEAARRHVFGPTPPESVKVN